MSLQFERSGLFLFSRSWNSGPALYPFKGIGGGMAIPPTSLQVSHIARSQMRWLGHVDRMPSKCAILGTSHQEETPVKAQDMTEGLHLSGGLRALRDPLDEQVNVAWEREAWVSSFRLLPPRPNPGQTVKDGWM